MPADRRAFVQPEPSPAYHPGKRPLSRPEVVSMKIMLVEDEARAAAYLAQGLAENGYAVEVASTGTDGLHAAVSSEHHLIILDVMLPGIDGFAVLTALRTCRETPVLML